MTISLCMIVKNEEKVLGRCLESMDGLADELIVVDTGSTDRTREIAAAHGAKVYDFTWRDDFSAARNESFSKATMDYQMWLDADDVIPPDQAERLRALKEALAPETDVVTMKYHTHFDADGHPTLTTTRGRLFRRAAGFLWHDPVHEYVQQRGAIVHSEIAIWHKKEAGYTDRNLKIYEAQRARGQAFSPRSTYYYARELMDHRRYDEAAEWFERFLDEGLGWVEDNIGACVALARCCGALGRQRERRWALLRSFGYDLPRPEPCCELGYDYLHGGDPTRAAYWFEAALAAPPVDGGGFVRSDYAGYIPHIELCVCYYRMGKHEHARWHNEQAGLCRPASAAVAHNRELFREC